MTTIFWIIVISCIFSGLWMGIGRFINYDIYEKMPHRILCSIGMFILSTITFLVFMLMIFGLLKLLFIK